MISLRDSVVMIILACVVLLMSACNSGSNNSASSNPPQGPPPADPGKVKAVTTVIINVADLTANPLTCTQSPPFVSVTGTDTIKWKAVASSGTVTSVEVQFNSPFTDFKAASSSVTSGATNTPVISGTAYPYSAVIVNGIPCKNPFTLGIIMM